MNTVMNTVLMIGLISAVVLLLPLLLLVLLFVRWLRGGRDISFEQAREHYKTLYDIDDTPHRSTISASDLHVADQPAMPENTTRATSTPHRPAA